MPKKPVGITPGIFYMPLNKYSFTFDYMEIGFTMDQDALSKEMVRIGAPAEARVLPDRCQGLSTQVYDKKGRPYSIITLSPSFHKPISMDLGVICHEAVHVKQHLAELLAEEKPGAEWEAYVTESITVFCVEHYLRARQRHDEMVVKQKTVIEK